MVDGSNPLTSTKKIKKVNVMKIYYASLNYYYITNSVIAVTQKCRTRTQNMNYAVKMAKQHSV